jgi:hypothetical protein
METNNKPTVELRDWCIRYGSAYGKAYGHPRFKDGTPIVTSSIVSMNTKDDMVIIETRNTIYNCTKNE